MSKLLIIGNGFDLTCGLKSSYQDFFAWENKNSEAFETFYVQTTGDYSHAPHAIKTSLGIIITKPAYMEAKALTEELTVWDMYFVLLKRECEYWCDIEKAIKDSLLGQESFWNKALIHLRSVLRNYNSGKRTENDLSLIERFIWQYVFNKNAPMEDREYGVFTKKLEFSQDEYYELLLEQLELFENKFRKYISQSIDSTSGYYKNATDLTSKLLNINYNDEPTTYSVMNFNYTNPFSNWPGRVRFICDNVHGSIASNYSIFGIDSKIREQDGSLQQISQSSLAYRFTKQRRCIAKMAEGKESPRVISNQYNELVFYGHSLNEQDYSYFHTLFDLCDLYGSELKLSFYYKEYGETPDNNKRIQSARITEILALLGRYGETFSNKSHGVNLIDKLYNERRLLIKAI